MKSPESWVDEEFRAYMLTQLDGPGAEHTAREAAMRWRCPCGHVMPGGTHAVGDFYETVKFCGVCGKRRWNRPPDRSLKEMAIYRTQCSVSFDGDFQILADGRRRGLWPWSRQINSFEQDAEIGELLEWDQVKELRDVLTRALRSREHPEELIAACATKDKKEQESRL